MIITVVMVDRLNSGNNSLNNTWLKPADTNILTIKTGYQTLAS